MHEPARISDATPEIVAAQLAEFEELSELPTGRVLTARRDAAAGGTDRSGGAGGRCGCGIDDRRPDVGLNYGFNT